MQDQSLSPLTVAGVMTGTSADGIDVGVCRLEGESPADLIVELIAHDSLPLPEVVAQLVRKAPSGLSGEEYARLEFHLSTAIGQALLTVRERTPFQIAAVHGQTIWHHPPPAAAPATHQVLDPHRIALVTGIPVVWDFRRADVAVGGQGAPLAPVGHWILFRNHAQTVAVVNVGGIANCTILPANGGLTAVRAWDTGPGMMVSDALSRIFLGAPFDREGAAAGRGRVLEPLLQSLLSDSWFAQPPPRSAGREQFGDAFVERLRTHPLAEEARPEDLLRTAVALSAEAIARSLRDAAPQRLILCGGGARNRTLHRELAERLPNVELRSSDAFGLAVEAVEAVCFAILGALRVWGEPLDLSGLTGARKRLFYGQICDPAPV